MVLIERIQAREILDSRGTPTVEARVTLSDESTAVASVPSGVSTSTFEAYELRDKNVSRYEGNGVSLAVKNVNTIIEQNLRKANPLEQEKVDKILNSLDQTPNKAHIGGNAMLAVSYSVARVAALLAEKPLWLHINELFEKVKATDINNEEIKLLPTATKPRLPIPLMLMVEGGRHANNKLDIQEFLIIPNRSMSVADQIRVGAEIRDALAAVAQEKELFVGIGDEGALSCDVRTLDEVFEMIESAVSKTGRSLRKDVALALDVAADSAKNKKGLKEQAEKLTSMYPIVLLEDPLLSEDMTGWVSLHAALKGQARLVGDDLIATNPQRLKEAISQRAIDLTILKPNQIGTLSEALQVAKIAKHHGLGIVASHRGGETTDTFITDIAVGVGADYLKAGSLRGGRVAKYNRLMEIATERAW